MEWLWKKPWFVLVGVIVLVQVFGSSSGCFPEEKRSLLDFKAAYSNDSLLPSWVDDPKSNCCDWERVTCDSSSAHVINLSLYGISTNGSMPDDHGAFDCYGFPPLNGSLFLSFKELRSLNLSYNCFGDFIRKPDNRSTSTLESLETLDLSHNNLDKSIIEFLYGLTSLKNLILAANNIVGLFPSQGLCKLKKLEVLDFHGNNFNGNLDTCLGNLTSLRTVDLSNNALSGSISAPLIASLASLEQLSLNGNKFEGLLSLNILANLTKLKELRLGDMNSKTFQVQTENPPWIASFQLEQLDISSCKVNSPTNTTPTFLSSQNGLKYIDLSGNNLVGMFPNWLLVNYSKLEEVYLNGNSFTGPFKLPIDPSYHMNQVHMLNISSNQIHGELPNNIGFFFPHLEYLDVSSNRFDGHIPASIGEMSNLRVLSLGNNNFSGNIPQHIVDGCISLLDLFMENNQLNGTLLNLIGKPGLYTLSASRNNFEGPITQDKCRFDLFIIDLSHNKFSGALPSCWNMSSASIINLQGNSLTGTIPEGLISNSSRLLVFDLSDNNFTGTIPESIYRLESLKLLLLAGNQLQGQLSSQICQLRKLQILDLSHNNFTGSIPSCLQNITFGNGTDLFSILDLSSNQLSGEIPHQIGDLGGLAALNLSHNQLNGTIPESFHNLQSVESLDLSNNNLSGQIPLQLEDLHFLSTFNVSYNNLSGRVPNGGQFSTFDESSYKGNPYLNWNFSNRRIAALPPPPTPLDEGKEENSAINFTSFCWSFATSYVTLLLLLVTILCINPY